MELYEQTTQYSCWRFSASQLQHMRSDKHEKAIERVCQLIDQEKALSSSSSSSSSSLSPSADLNSDDAEKEEMSEPPSVDDEILLCGFYAGKLMDYCRYFKFPVRVQATAMIYFKRFYLYQSMLDHDPKQIMYEMSAKDNFDKALYYVTKANLYNYVKNIPKLEAATVRELEYVVLDALKFHLACHHPYIALHGLFLDVQTIDKYATEQDLNWLQSIYDRSIQLAHDSLFTDLSFIYQPAQIAAALFSLAASEASGERDEAGFDFEKSYLAVRYADNPLLPVLKEIIQEIQRIMCTELRLPTGKEYKEAAGVVDKKLARWRNPLMDPESKLYQIRQEQEKQREIIEESQKQQKTAESKASTAADIEATFG